MCLTCSNLQPHDSMLPVAKGLNVCLDRGRFTYLRHAIQPSGRFDSAIRKCTMVHSQCTMVHCEYTTVCCVPWYIVNIPWYIVNIPWYAVYHCTFTMYHGTFT